MIVPKYNAAYSEIIGMLLKLETGAAIEPADRRWLLELLYSITGGENVSQRFTRRVKGRPNAERDYFVALDLKRHLRDGEQGAYKLVARRWNINDKKGGAIEAVKQIARRQKAAMKEAHLLIEHPGLAKTIELQRIRLLSK